MSIESSLTVRNVRLKEWPKDRDLRTFRYGQFSGLIDLREEIVIIGIFADFPGSGKLGDVVSQFEAAAEENGVELRVVHFWNERLRQWFARRGYYMSHRREFGQYAERAPKVCV